MVVNTATLKANPKLGKSHGAWYETMTVMFKGDAATKQPVPRWPKRRVPIWPILESAGHHQDVRHTQRSIRLRQQRHGREEHGSGGKFSFSHGLLGEGESVDAVLVSQWQAAG
jgi:hypothetical protein